MTILGIDPGYAIIGYGIIEFNQGRYISKDYNAIYTDVDQNFGIRLEKIFDSISEIVIKYKPDYVAIEKLYFQSNHKTAIKVAEARGVIILAIQKFKINFYEYTPLQVKSAVTGYGKANKIQVMNMTKSIRELHDDLKSGKVTSDELVRESLEKSHEIIQSGLFFLMRCLLSFTPSSLYALTWNVTSSETISHLPISFKLIGISIHVRFEFAIYIIFFIITNYPTVSSLYSTCNCLIISIISSSALPFR